MVHYRAKAIGLVLGLTDPLRMHNDQPLGPVETVVSPQSSVKVPELNHGALAKHAQHTGGTPPAADAVEDKSPKVGEKEDVAAGGGTAGAKDTKDEFEKFEAKEKEEEESKARPSTDAKEAEPHTPCKRPASSSDGMPPAKRAAKMLTRYIAEFSGPQAKPPPTRSYRNLIVLG